MEKFNQEEFRKLCAEREGFKKDIEGFWYQKDVMWTDRPRYDNETDILRVVRLLSEKELMDYVDKLMCIVDVPHSVYHTATATADQMAKTLWEVLKGQ